MYSAEVKGFVKNLYERKYPIEEIVALTSVSRRVIFYWVKTGFSGVNGYLNKPATARRKELKAQAIQMIKENPFMTQKEVADKLGVSCMTVCNYFKEENITRKKR